MRTTGREPDGPPGAPVMPLEACPRRIHSPALFRGNREIVILHGGAQYRLRITKGDKLILTK